MHLKKIKIVALLVMFNKIVLEFKKTNREKLPIKKKLKIQSKINKVKNNRSHKTRKSLKISLRFKNKCLKIVESR
jgi:hypothetical protein